MSVTGISSSNNTQGFFTSDGVLQSSGTSNSSQDSTTSEIQSSVASSIATEISDAAVALISQQLNVAGTGFDAGVSDLVASAVSAGLKNQADRQGDSTSGQPIQIGGSYQNSILDQSGAAPSTDTVA